MLRFFDVDGVTLHARFDAPRQLADPAGPTLVYLHSLGSELRIWDGVVDRLPSYQHLRLDLRGHGLSDAPAGEYSVAPLAADVVGVLMRANVERAIVVGVSVGGQVALRAALSAPDRVVGVVAMDTAARIRDADAWHDRMRAVEGGGLEPLVEATVARWFAPSYLARDPLAPRGYRNLLRRASTAGYLATCAALRDEDLTDRLIDITQPVLVLCGSEDTATPPALVRKLAAGLPRARYLEIADAAHLPCLDRPDETARAIDEFAREVHEASQRRAS